MQLLNLLHNCPITLQKQGTHTECQGLSLDSRTVKPGDVFLAYPGEKEDRRRFAQVAIQKGAIAIVYDGCDGHILDIDPHADVSIIAYPQLAQAVSHLAARFYGNPSASLKTVAVTGTNGKTSCSYYLAQGLHLCGNKAAIMGTLGVGVYPTLTETGMTTPDPIAIQRLFSEWVEQKVNFVSMEASSHALDQHRLDAVHVDVAVYTQLTQDHLDYHRTMEAYGLAKRRLFSFPTLRAAVMNADDALGREWLALPALKDKVFAYGLQPPSPSVRCPYIQAIALSPLPSGFKVTVRTPWGEGDFLSPLLGEFNVSNLLAVLTTWCLNGMDFQLALQLLGQLQPVPGRMQMISAGLSQNAPRVIVDYAHTPDALEKALKALRRHCQGKLWCVFGCGGERDRQKRPLMGQIAELYADRMIITNDNPRHEDPLVILAEIRAGLRSPQAVEVELERAQAIQKAIHCASAEDVILVAGKGHEKVQWLGDVAFPSCDIDIVKRVYEMKRG